MPETEPNTEAEMTARVIELTEDLQPAEIMSVILTVADAFDIDVIHTLEAMLAGERLGRYEQVIADLILDSQEGGDEPTRRLLEAVRLDQAISEL